MLVHNFLRKLCCGSKKWRRFGGRLKIIFLNSRLQLFPEFRHAGCEDCVCSEQDHPEFLLQEEVSLEEQKARKQDRFLGTPCRDGHACNVSDGTRKEGHTCGCQKGGSVIRSLGEDVRVVLVVKEALTCVSTANGRLVGGKRMVAHHVANVSFLHAVVVRRRTFMQEDPSIVFLTMWLFVAPSAKVEV